MPNLLANSSPKTKEIFYQKIFKLNDQVQFDTCLIPGPGGMVFRLVEDWTKAGLLKLFWMLVAGKQGRKANWMRQRYLRRKDIWEVKLQNESSWVCKDILFQCGMRLKVQSDL